MLEIRNLCVRRDGSALVADASLAVRAGELCVIVGPNGAGKSSLLRAAAGDIASEGAVEFLGAAAASWKGRARAQRLAVLPQHAHLGFDFLVREVVALGRAPHRDADPSRRDRIVGGALVQVGLEAFAERRYLTLSGGEMQRTQLARVFAQVWDEGLDAPGGEKLLLLDEPTSALDISQQAAILRAAWAFTRNGGAVVCVLHDLNLAAAFADRIIVMRKGAIIADGAVAHVMESGKLQEAFGPDLRLGSVAGRWVAHTSGPT